MKKSSITLFLLIGMIIGITTSCTKTETEKGSRGIEFQKQPMEFTKAIHMAWKQDKMMLIHILPPTEMESIHSGDDEITTYTNNHFISYELPFEHEESDDWLKRYDIVLNDLGVTIIINPNGQETIDIISDKVSNDTFLRRLKQAVEPDNSLKFELRKKELEDQASLDELAQLLIMMHEDDDDCHFVGIKYLTMKEEVDLNNEADVIAVAHGTDELFDENVKLFIENVSTVHANFPELFEYKMIRLLDKVRDNAISFGDRDRLMEEIHLIYPGYVLAARDEVHSEEEVFDLIEVQILTK